MRDLRDAIKNVIDGDGILFLGAGFSLEAINILGKKLNDASELSKDLCSELNITHNKNLSDVSDFYMDNIEDGDKKLVGKLKNYYKCKSVSKSHDTIASLKWKRVYTTNYDNVFEVSSNNVGQRRTGYIISDNLESVEKKESILHINGYIDRLTVDQLNDQFKLTTTSYMRDDFDKTSWCGLFRNDISNAKTIILIGVSMDYDEQLQKLLAENPEYSKKIFFIDKKEEEKFEVRVSKDPMYKYKKRKYGEIYEIGVDGFSDLVKEIEKSYVAKTRKIDFVSFKNLNDIEYKTSKVLVNDYWSLLIYGHVKEELIYNNFNNNNYIIDREQFIHFDDEFINLDVKKIAVIHSDLGNGKTCSAMKLAHKLKDQGEVFWLVDEMKGIEKEIEEISEKRGKKYIFIENYGNHLKLLEKIKLYIDKDIKIIVTERTYLHSSIYVKLKDTLNLEDNKIVEYDLNKILWNDKSNVVSLINNIEKWDNRELTDQDKRRLIDNAFREVLIKLVESKEISDRINKIYGLIRDNRVKKGILIAVCINSILNIGLDLNDIIALLELKVSNTIIRDRNINELVDFKGNVIHAKSSILAGHLIKSNFLERDALDIMKLMANKANKLQYGTKMESVIKRLVSSSNIWLVLKCRNKRIFEAVLEYYDELRNYKMYKNNPFFFLQYAMACLDMKYYDRAENYLDIAYAEAEKKNVLSRNRGIGEVFDTFQIDTQNGRYILERAIDEKNQKNPLETFKKVHNLFITTLLKDKTQEQLVFKQVGNYKLYFEVYKDYLSYDERREFLICVEEMISKINMYLHKKNKGDVKEVEKTLNSLAEEITKSILYCICE